MTDEPKNDEAPESETPGTTEETPKAEKKPAAAKKKPAAKAKAEDAPDAEATSDADAAEDKPAKKPAAKKKPAAAKAKAEPKAEEAKAEEPKADAPKEETPKAEKPAAAKKPAAKADKKPAANGDRPTVRAHAKYVRTSARKARLVCDHIRGKNVDEARAILAHTQRAVARDWSKLLESAIANAEHNHELVGEDLKVLSVTADEGPTLKRFQPRAMGRATQIRKRTSHLTITLTPKD